jgi:hypothetical protein
MALVEMVFPSGRLICCAMLVPAVKMNTIKKHDIFFMGDNFFFKIEHRQAVFKK